MTISSMEVKVMPRE